MTAFLDDPVWTQLTPLGALIGLLVALFAGRIVPRSHVDRLLRSLQDQIKQGMEENALRVEIMTARLTDKDLVIADKNAELDIERRRGDEQQKQIAALLEGMQTVNAALNALPRLSDE